MLSKGFAGLVIGFHLPRPARGQSGFAVAAGSSAFAPNAFIHIGTDDLVTVLVKHIEFGQGPFTGLATLVAEELDADWAQMRAKHLPSDPALSGIAFGLGPDARTSVVFPGAANDNRRRA